MSRKSWKQSHVSKTTKANARQQNLAVTNLTNFPYLCQA